MTTDEQIANLDWLLLRVRSRALKVLQYAPHGWGRPELTALLVEVTNDTLLTDGAKDAMGRVKRTIKLSDSTQL